MKTMRKGAAALALLVAGCQTVEYVQPETAEGKACASQCEVTNTACIGEKNREADAKRSQCERDSADKVRQCEGQARDKYQACQRQADADYNSCQFSGSSGSYKPVCTRRSCNDESYLCSKNFCTVTPDTVGCTSAYQTCFKGCGGVVNVK